MDNHCKCCGVVFTTVLPSGTFNNAKLGMRIGDFICDVVGYRREKVALVGEIANKHSVDANKAISLELYWVELMAEDIVREPFQWGPSQTRIKDSYCTDCKAHLKEVVSLCDHFSIAPSEIQINLTISLILKRVLGAIRRHLHFGEMVYLIAWMNRLCRDRQRFSTVTMNVQA